MPHPTALRVVLRVRLDHCLTHRVPSLALALVLSAVQVVALLSLGHVHLYRILGPALILCMRAVEIVVRMRSRPLSAPVLVPRAPRTVVRVVFEIMRLALA